MKIRPVILCGGAGTRLWPNAKKHQAKQFIDFGNWTFWGYRGGGWQKGNGLRIDHFLTTANITDLIKKVEVNREPRGWEKASDHTPVTITLEN